MGKLKMFGIGMTVAVALLAYILYTPMPPEAEEPYRQMAFLARFKLVLGLISVVDMFGYNGVELFRAMRSVKPAVDLNDTVTSLDDRFDGVDVRVYRPKDQNEEFLPALVFFHGGGWVFGSRDSHDPTMRKFVRKKRMVVVSVEYRLAPEFPFPTPVEDCLTATQYFLRHAKQYQADPERVGVMGDSAGGNLAAAVSHMLSSPHSPDLPKLKVQVLIYPAVQAFQFQSPAYIKYTGSSVPSLLNSERMSEFWLRYAFGHEFTKVNHMDLLSGKHLTADWLKSKEARYFDSKNLPPKFRRDSTIPSEVKNDTLSRLLKPVFLDHRFSPLLADDETMRKAPDTYILTAEFDPLRDDGFYLATRLRELDVRVEHRHYTGMDHGFLSISLYKNSMKAVGEICDYLHRAL